MPGSHGSGCGCQHDLSQPIDGTEWLDKWIDHDGIEVLNEFVAGSAAKSLFRPYSERLQDPEIPCQYKVPEDDEENLFGNDTSPDCLVVSVPFTCPVKISGLCVIGGPNGCSPSRVDLYSNPPSIDTVHEVAVSQSIDPLVEDFCGVVEYPLRPVKFSQVTRLVLSFPGSTPTESAVQLYWLGIKGIASGDQRRAVVTVYESRPNLSDHPVKDSNLMTKHIT